MSAPAKGVKTERKKRTLEDREKKKKAVKDESAEDKKPEREIKTVQKKKEPDEYDYDSSDEEDLRNTIGNIPVDKLNNIASGKYPVVGYNPYEPFLDIFSSEKSIHPIDNRPEPKARFIPSKDEMRIVSRMVHAIKMGWARGPKQKEEKKFYDIWAAEDAMDHKTKSELARMRMHMPAPKMPLPVHAESWEEAEPEDRTIQFIPQKYDALRKVPQYNKFITERFERCLDLYLAPRKIKMKLQVDPSDLLPDLPNPEDLRPFPTTLAFVSRYYHILNSLFMFIQSKRTHTK
ncbi:unnamed protein product [Nippostrongylus brasiliensis]|uniref:Ribosome biogenesis protein BOP1 homolog (inferred by orthology to a C. elegans protein) n=1 Tax=Nippostrongylus brasiliensis TaxID=27835 RepID=A0A0N4YXZ1_NIPBR|nr:unnamed protein product [Nippostrongylus brasiliensis]